MSLALGAALVACQDATSPLGARPGSVAALKAPKAPKDSAHTVTVLQRNKALAADVSASATIGVHGGSISLKGTGVKVIFPTGAVAQPTLITVTAVAGQTLLYEFQPHGLVFHAPVSVQQDLKPTNAEDMDKLTNSLAGVYIPDESTVNDSTSTAEVTEFQPTVTDVVDNKATFSIKHFSVYSLVGNRAAQAAQ